MKVYLDNNILVDIEEGTYQLYMFQDQPQVSYYFSEVHMDELMNGLNNNLDLKNIRLATLEQLCGHNYIIPGVLGSGIESENITPKNAFELSMKLKFLHDQIYQFANSMSFDRDSIIDSLKMEKKEVGNFRSDEILPVIEQKMLENWGYGIKTYLEMQ